MVDDASDRFYCYILQSEATGRFYVGSSGFPDRRLEEHNAGRVTATRQKGPWRRVLLEEFPSRIEAVRRERQIKAWKSATAIRSLIGEVGAPR